MRALALAFVWMAALLCSFAANAALSVAQYAQVANFYDATTHPKTVTGLAWNAGDIIVVMAGVEGVGPTVAAPTNANLTFGAADASQAAGSNETEFLIWHATASSSQTGQTISVDRDLGAGHAYGFAVWVVTGSPTGVANAAANRTESTITASVSSGSVVVYGYFDWNAAAAGRTQATASGTATERYDNSNGINYGIYIGDWVGVSAGSTAFGVTSYSGLQISHGIIEVTGSAGSPATLSSPTPSGTLGTSTTATIGATTDDGSGTTFYAVVDTDSLSGITATQVKAAQDAGGAAVVASCNAAVSTTSPSCGVTGLTASTAYNYAAVQTNAGGDSNVVTGTFTTGSAASALLLIRRR